MTKRDWLLLAAYFGHEQGLTPVQLQKCLFLLGREMPEDVGMFYQFVPHNYGPFSRDLYTDAELLSRAGLIAIERDNPSSYDRYLATALGRDRVVNELERVVPRRASDYLANVVDWAQKQSFSGLVRAIYSKYPEFRINSVFQN